MNPLYQQLQGNTMSPMMQQLMNFRKTFTGNPQQMVQSMINSGRISQEQVNQLAQQANQIYQQLNGMR